MNRRNLMEAFWLKLRFDLKEEASHSYLNYIWWLLEPALLVTVFYVVFEILLNRGGENFLLFLICGKIPFLWFSKSVTNSANSIIAGRGLINQMAIPKPFFPLLVVAQDLIKQLFVMLALILFIWGSGFAPQPDWFALPIVMIVQLLMISAVALATAAIVPFIPDFRFIISTGMIMLMFGSGIFYDYRTALLEQHQQLFLFNPMARLIEAYRDILIRNSTPDWAGMAAVAAASLFMLWILLVYYKYRDHIYARLVVQ